MTEAQTEVVDLSTATEKNPIPMVIPVTLVKQHGKTLRKVNKDSDDYKVQVLGSIRDEGQRQPISLASFMDEDGNPVQPTGYIIAERPHKGKISTFDEVLLVDGGHRVEAHLDLIAEGLAEFAYIRAEYCGVMSQEDRLIAQVQFNKNRVETTPGEIAEQCGKILMTNPGWTQEQLAKKLHMNKGTLSQLLKINRLPDFAREACSNGDINAANAIKLAQLPTDLVDTDWVDKAKTTTCTEFAQEIDDAKKAARARNTGDAKPGEFVPPSPKVRKAKDIIELYEDGEKREELGLDFETLKYIVQQDDDTMAAARAKHEEKLASKAKGQARAHCLRSAKGFGIEFTPEEEKASGLSVEDIIARVADSDRPGAAEGAQSLTKYVAGLMSGEGMSGDSTAKPEGSAPSKAR